jgi:dual 3',5'-cyclic-AMP and -GMP phosphodiesterase 11
LSHSPELAHAESILDENPAFFQDYLIRKATRPMIDAWLLAHAMRPGSAYVIPGGDSSGGEASLPR